MDEWTFPVGTRFYKEFSFSGLRIETRMIWKKDATHWFPVTYKWTPDGETGATELLTGELNATDAGYEIPSQTECFDCHGGRKDFVLGFEAVSLATPQAQAASPLNMATLISEGLLSNVPDGGTVASLAIPGTAVEQAALGYLHINCGVICHNRNPTSFAAGRTTLFMRLNVAELATVQATDTYQTAWNQNTGSFFLDGVAKRIDACNAPESCIYYRDSHRDGLNGAATGTQMPPIDTHRVDDAGVSLVAAWINEGCEGGGAPLNGGGGPDAGTD
jgi:hypothetical protein